MQTTHFDPIITEVRAIRDEYASRFNYDVGRMFRDLQARQNISDRKYVCYPARRPSTDPNIRQNQRFRGDARKITRTSGYSKLTHRSTMAHPGIRCLSPKSRDSLPT